MLGESKGLKPWGTTNTDQPVSHPVKAASEERCQSRVRAVWASSSARSFRLVSIPWPEGVRWAEMGWYGQRDAERQRRFGCEPILVQQCVGVLRCRKSTEAPGWRIAVVVPIGWLNQAASIKPLAEADWHISINCGHRIWVLMEQQLPHRKKTSWIDLPWCTRHKLESVVVFKSFLNQIPNWQRSDHLMCQRQLTQLTDGDSQHLTPSNPQCASKMFSGRRGMAGGRVEGEKRSHWATVCHGFWMLLTFSS
jgi:hypothetical protein